MTNKEWLNSLDDLHRCLAINITYKRFNSILVYCYGMMQYNNKTADEIDKKLIELFDNWLEEERKEDN